MLAFPRVALLQARPSAASSIMGLFAPGYISQLRRAGIAWFATVTTLREALARKPLAPTRSLRKDLRRAAIAVLMTKRDRMGGVNRSFRRLPTG